MTTAANPIDIQPATYEGIITWDVERCRQCSCPCQPCTCVENAFIPVVTGYRRPLELWYSLKEPHRGRLCVVLAILNLTVMKAVIVILPEWYVCKQSSTEADTEKQAAFDLFVLVGTEYALSQSLALISAVLYSLGALYARSYRRAMISEDDMERIYSLMGLKFEENSYQFTLARAGWLGKKPPEARAIDWAYLVRRLEVLGQLLKDLGVYDEVMLLLPPLSQDSAIWGWEIKPPPGSADDVSYFDGPRRELEAFKEELRGLGERTKFVVRFWDRTQGADRMTCKEDLPIEIEILTLIMRTVNDRLDVLPIPHDLVFSLLASLSASWVITFVALNGKYSTTVFGVLYGGAQVTAFTSFWYLMLNVLWLKLTPPGYVKESIRRVLDKLDRELCRCEFA